MFIREAARAIVCDENHKVLLIKIEDHGTIDLKQPKKDAFWVTPGGGLMPGESHRQALARELREEIGLDTEILGPCLWRGQIDLVWNGVPTTIKERYFLVRTKEHRVDLANMEAAEKQVYRAHGWFSTEQIRQCAQIVLPKDLADLLDQFYASEATYFETEIDLSTPTHKGHSKYPVQ